MVLLLVVNLPIYSDITSDSTQGQDFEEFLKLLYQSNNIQINNNYIALSYGKSNLFAKNLVNEKLSSVYSSKIEYGFLRQSATDNDLILYLASEGGYLSNISSHLKPKNWTSYGLLFDEWAFGFNYKNGYGYNIDNDIKLFLLHYGSLDWKKISFETFSPNSTLNKLLLYFNNDFRFGTSYESEVRLILSNIFLVQFSYSESILFRRHLFGKWALGSLIELLAQRGIDLLSPNLIQTIPSFQPIINFAIKTFISSLIYQRRQSDAFFPFESEAPLRFDNYRFSVGLTF